MENLISNKDYFFILYDFYLKCEGGKQYIDYIENKLNDTECIYELFKDAKIKTGSGITRKKVYG